MHTRRTLLKAGMVTSTLAVAAGAGLLTPRLVLAAWPKQAFTAKKYNDALQALEGSTQVTDSKQIIVKVSGNFFI